MGECGVTFLVCDRRVAAANLLLAPFLLVFLLIYFFMRNAEKFYHQPSSAGARRWSSLAAWRLREFNELPHYLNHRSPAFPLSWKVVASAADVQCGKLGWGRLSQPCYDIAESRPDLQCMSGDRRL